jgi:hypothetical protein
LAEAFLFVGFRGQVEEALVFSGVLEDGCGFAIYGEGDGALRCLDLADKFGGLVEEGGERLDFEGGCRVGLAWGASAVWSLPYRHR